MRLDQIRLARPYAQALFSMAKNAEDLDSLFEHLSCLDQIIQDPEMAVFLKSPTVFPLNKKAVLEAVWLKFSVGLSSELASNFLSLLVKNNRLFILPEVIDALRALRDQKRNCYKAVVEGAYPLKDDQESFLQSWLEVEMGKKVYIEYHLNPELLSGFKAKVGDRVVYASSEHLLNQLSESLKQEASF